MNDAATSRTVNIPGPAYRARRRRSAPAPARSTRTWSVRPGSRPATRPRGSVLPSPVTFALGDIAAQWGIQYVARNNPGSAVATRGGRNARRGDASRLERARQFAYAPNPLTAPAAVPATAPRPAASRAVAPQTVAQPQPSPVPAVGVAPQAQPATQAQPVPKPQASPRPAPVPGGARPPVVLRLPMPLPGWIQPTDLLGLTSNQQPGLSSPSSRSPSFGDSPQPQPLAQPQPQSRRCPKPAPLKPGKGFFEVGDDGKEIRRQYWQNREQREFKEE